MRQKCPSLLYNRNTVFCFRFISVVLTASKTVLAAFLALVHIVENTALVSLLCSFIKSHVLYIFVDIMAMGAPHINCWGNVEFCVNL